MRFPLHSSDGTVQHWIKGLGAPQRLARVHAAARLSALGKADPAVVAALIEVLGRGTAPARTMAAQALGGIGPGAAAAVGALVGALEDEDAGVARRAALALGQLGAAAALWQALEHTAPGVRGAAALGLEECQRRAA
jgi:HEAT repeat protein